MTPSLLLRVRFPLILTSRLDGLADEISDVVKKRVSHSGALPFFEAGDPAGAAWQRSRLYCLIFVAYCPMPCSYCPMATTEVSKWNALAIKAGSVFTPSSRRARRRKDLASKCALIVSS